MKCTGQGQKLDRRIRTSMARAPGEIFQIYERRLKFEWPMNKLDTSTLDSPLIYASQKLTQILIRTNMPPRSSQKKK
jgi:hypothetical protein